MKIFRPITAGLTVLLLFGCDSKIVAPPTNGTSLSVRIDVTDASPKLLAVVDQFRVIVIDPAISDTLADNQLTMDPNGFVVGTIDSLPSAVNLTFTAQAIDGQSGLIFSGTTNATLASEIINQVQINLSPVVPLMKFTPRHFDIVGTDTSTHDFDIKIFNVDSLYGVTFRVRYDQNYLIAVNAKLDSSQNPSNVLFFQFDSTDAFGPYKAIAISGVSLANALVDANGDGVLCNVSFVLERPFTLADSTFLQIEPTGMTHQNQSTIPTGILYSDDAFIRITP